MAVLYGVSRMSVFGCLCSGVLVTPLQYLKVHNFKGDRGRTAVKVLCYKSEDRWFDSR